MNRLPDNLPDNWQLLKLKEIAKWGSGGTPKSTNDEYYGGDIPWLVIGDLNDSYVRESQKTITDKGLNNSSAKIVAPDNILIAMYGSIGKLGINKIPLATNQAIAFTTQINENIYNRYLFYYLFSIRSHLHSLGKGGTQQNISQTVLKEVEIPIPPESIQHQIVEKIEELFSDLDNGIDNLKKAKQQLETYKQSVLKAAFEGKLTKEWREQQDNLSTPEELKEQIEEERQRYREQQLKEWEQEVEEWKEQGEQGKKPRKPRKIRSTSPIEEDDINDKHSLPDKWSWTRVGDIGKVGTGSTPLKKKHELYYEGGEIPWVTSGALNDWYVKEASGFVTKKALEETNLTVYPKHTLLVAMYGEGKTRGKCSELLIEACTNQAVAAIVQEKTEAKTRQFLKYFFLKNYNDIRRLSAGGVQPNLNLGIIRDTLVPLPPLKEQEKIVEELESRLSVVQQNKKTISAELQKAKALRQSILKKAFEGKLIQKEIKENLPVEEELIPFNQMQMIGILIDTLEKEFNMAYGEMALAKYLYLIDRIKKYKTGLKFKDWHWGPYDPLMKGLIYKKDGFFKTSQKSTIQIKEGKRETLLKYNIHDRELFEEGVREISQIIGRFEGKKSTSRQLELLATVCKVIENVQSTDLKTVRNGMEKWDTEKGDYKNKAAKFSEDETERCLDFVTAKGWDSILLNS